MSLVDWIQAFILVILGGLFVSIVLWDSLLKAGIVEDVMRWIVENLKGE